MKGHTNGICIIIDTVYHTIPHFGSLCITKGFNGCVAHPYPLFVAVMLKKGRIGYGYAFYGNVTYTVYCQRYTWHFIMVTVLSVTVYAKRKK